MKTCSSRWSPSTPLKLTVPLRCTLIFMLCVLLCLLVASLWPARGWLTPNPVSISTVLWRHFLDSVVHCLLVSAWLNPSDSQYGISLFGSRTLLCSRSLGGQFSCTDGKMWLLCSQRIMCSRKHSWAPFWVHILEVKEGPRPHILEAKGSEAPHLEV